MLPAAIRALTDAERAADPDLIVRAQAGLGMIEGTVGLAGSPAATSRRERRRRADHRPVHRLLGRDRGRAALDRGRRLGGGRRRRRQGPGAAARGRRCTDAPTRPC